MFLIAGMLIMLISCAGVSIAQPAAKDIDTSFKFEEPITLHEPIAVDVLIVNRAVYAISIDLGFENKEAFRFRIVTPDKQVIEASSEKQPKVGLIGTVYLTPKEKYIGRILLDEWCPFDKPGNYYMIASARIPIAIGKVPSPYKLDKSRYLQTVTDDAKLHLVILPRDETALRKRCETLYAQLREAREDYDVQRFAKELSYVRDPIAIPYLSKLIGKREEWFAVQGLRHIDTDEAWETMISIANGKYDKVNADYAKSLLREKLPEIRDPKIRRKVETAIGNKK